MKDAIDNRDGGSVFRFCAIHRACGRGEEWARKESEKLGRPLTMAEVWEHPDLRVDWLIWVITKVANREELKAFIEELIGRAVISWYRDCAIDYLKNDDYFEALRYLSQVMITMPERIKARWPNPFKNGGDAGCAGEGG